MNLDFDSNIEHIRDGFIGESIVRELLKSKKNMQFMQIDAMAKYLNKWYSIEIKHQSMFKGPPFDGHGLPIWQVESRILLYKDTNIIPLLFVLDKDTKALYYNSIVKLESSVKFTTNRLKRVIYPLQNFIHIKY